MSEKQKIPAPRDPRKPMQPGQNKTGKRGIEPEEVHREGGNRISDQGGERSKGTKR